MATVLFDVNETLLSLAPMAPVVEDVLGPGSTSTWFARLLHGSLVANHLAERRSFEEIGASELQRLAAATDMDVDNRRARAISASLRHLPPHADVQPGLAALAADGHRLVAFTNGSTAAAHEQLAHAVLDHHFDAILSVDAGPAFKPDPGAYRWAVDHLGARPADVTMVAAHDWDVAGARRAGLRGVFVQRGGPAWWLPLPQGPTVTALGDVARFL